MKLKDILTEKYEIDLEIGDTILRGKFKNKPVVVKDIGTDEHGQPTINGKKMLSFRIKKLMPKKESVNEGRPMFQDKPNELAYIDFKKWAYKNRKSIKGILNKAIEDGRDLGTDIFLALRQVWLAWSNKNAKEWSRIPNKGADGKDFGRALAGMMKKDNLIIKKSGNKLTDLNETAVKLQEFIPVSVVQEAFKKDGHQYNSHKVGKNNDNVWVGKDGVLANNGIFISWNEIQQLEKKYR